MLSASDRGLRPARDREVARRSREPGSFRPVAPAADRRHVFWLSGRRRPMAWGRNRRAPGPLPVRTEVCALRAKSTRGYFLGRRVSPSVSCRASSRRPVGPSGSRGDIGAQRPCATGAYVGSVLLRVDTAQAVDTFLTRGYREVQRSVCSCPFFGSWDSSPRGLDRWGGGDFGSSRCTWGGDVLCQVLSQIARESTRVSR